MMKRIHPTALIASIALTFSAAASGQTVYVVDDDGGAGVDFTSIQAAVDASVAGDRIDVRNGSYGPVTVDVGVTIMAEGDRALILGLTIANVPPGEVLALTDFDYIRDLRLRDNQGAVILDSVPVVYGNLWIERSTDVRIAKIQRASLLLAIDSFVQTTDCYFQSGVYAGRSSFTASDCTLKGQWGGIGQVTGIGMCDTPPGGPGVVVADHSHVRLLRTRVSGGLGASPCFGGPSGPTGIAIEVDPTSRVDRCKVLHFHDPVQYPGSDAIIVNPGGSYNVIDDLPSMELLGAAAIGQVAEFRCLAEAGSSARVFLGRRVAMTSVLPSLPLLHTAERGASIGAMPPSESRLLPFTIPALTRGTMIHAQMSRTLSGGQTELSNSVTLIVR